MRVDPTGGSSNSMSMLRAPDPESSIKGSSSNIPFWPGGLELPANEDVNLAEEEWTGTKAASFIFYQGTLQYDGYYQLNLSTKPKFDPLHLLFM